MASDAYIVNHNFTGFTECCTHYQPRPLVPWMLNFLVREAAACTLRANLDSFKLSVLALLALPSKISEPHKLDTLIFCDSTEPRCASKWCDSFNHLAN